ncbi:MAG TPA: SIMPL domain-containing protein [Patescibacteria group bacterium]|nr:SIMPL domain-containing protein [Patescibacteria group bacterium]
MDLKKKFNWNEFLKTPYATIVGSVLAIFLIAFLFFRFVGPIPVSVTQTTVEKTATFDVSDEGKTTAIPDTATVNLGIEIQKTTVQEAQKEANEKINSITNELKKIGVKEELIKTINYNLYPNYDYQSGQRIIGYIIDITLEVKVKDFDKINQVIDTATRLGANQIGQLDFTIDDQRLEELKMEARKEAIEKAKKKAIEIARAGGLKLGRIVNISENTTSPILPLYKSESIGLGGTEEATVPTQIQPGESEISITVTLSYETL